MLLTEILQNLKKQRVDKWVNRLEKIEWKTGKTPPQVMAHADLYIYIPHQSIIEYGLRSTERLNEHRKAEGKKLYPEDFAYQGFLKILEGYAAQIREDNESVEYPEKNFRSNP